MSIVDVTGDVPLVIAAHGTRDADGVACCRALVERVRGMLPGRRVSLGFVELAEPTIADAVREALDGREITGEIDAVVVPLMLATGGHVRQDIPEAFDEGRGDADVRYAAPLLPSPLLLDALLQRVREALGTWRADDTVGVLVGRGNLVTEANAEHYRLTRTLLEKAELGDVEPAFVQVCRPSVPEALNKALRAGATQIVVAQHFLFPGKLRTWTIDQVRAWAMQHREVEVRVADVIGDCDELARLVVDRYAQQLDAEGVDAGAPGYLSSLTLAGRDVLVVGGGAVAARRIPALLAAGARVRVIAPNTGIKVGRLIASGKVTWEQRAVRAEDVADAWYVLAASNDPTVNQQVAEEAERRHTFCVRADKAPAGSAATPATASAGGLTVAVVGDRNPRRSVRVRDELLKVLQG